MPKYAIITTPVSKISVMNFLMPSAQASTSSTAFVMSEPISALESDFFSETLSTSESDSKALPESALTEYWTVPAPLSE